MMNTIPEPPVPSVAEIARNRALLLDTITHRPQPRHRRRVAAGIAAAGVVALGGTAGAIVLTASPREISTGVVCYSDARQNVPSIRAVSADQISAVSVQMAIEVCRNNWQTGLITLGTVHRPDESGLSQYPDRPAPTLGACTGRDGVVAVFPLTGGKTAQSLCSDLQLREAPGKR